MARVALGLAVLLMACGGGEDAASAEQRICTAVVDCGGLGEAGLDDCVTSLEEVDGTRAKDECAACVESNTCGEVDDGACATDCSSILEAVDSIQEVAREICAYLVECLDGTPAEFDECVTSVTTGATQPEAVECRDCLNAETCSTIGSQCEAACGSL